MNFQYKLTSKDILRFWYPLAFTWILMSIEGPFLASNIARMDEPKYNLASYGIAFAFALILEAPLMMLLSASLALIKDFQSFRKLLVFTRTINFLVFLVHLIIISPPVYDSLMSLLGPPVAVQKLTHQALILLLPWPVAIGFRRFYQGLLLANKFNKMVAVGTTIRLVCMSTCCLFCIYFGTLSGVATGALSLSMGVVGEWLFVTLVAYPLVQTLKNSSQEGLEKTLTYSYIIKFYTPLALTSFIGLSVQPLVTFFVGLCSMPLESLAVLPVISSFIFIFKCVGLSFQEVAIALIGEKYEGYHIIKNFALKLAGLFSILLCFVAFTPLSYVWFHHVSGLSPELSLFASWPLKIMVVVPACSVLLCWQRAMAVNMGKNILITKAAICEFSAIILSMGAFVYFNLGHGALAACFSLMLGRFSSFFYLHLQRHLLQPPTKQEATHLVATS